MLFAAYPPAAASGSGAGRRGASRVQRALLWAALVALSVVAQTLLVVLTIRYESTRMQDDTDVVAAEAAVDVRREFALAMQALQTLAWADTGAAAEWRSAAGSLLTSRPGMQRVEFRPLPGVVELAVDALLATPLFGAMPRHELGVDTEVACGAAQRTAAPAFSRSYFVPLPGGLGLEVVDLCVPVQRGAQVAGTLVATFALAPLLEHTLQARDVRHHELSFVEGDGTRLARAGVPRGAGVYQALRTVALPGTALQLRADASAGRPSLIPNLAVALVLGLSIALFGLLLLLARDVRRRAEAERALAEALAFRSAMEDSLPTGLRARTLAGAISYVNPAFCAMVGFDADELRGAAGRSAAVSIPAAGQGTSAAAAPSPTAPAGTGNDPSPAPNDPPYWPPEYVTEYRRRMQQRITRPDNGQPTGPLRDSIEPPREGVETVFMRKGGERFPVMVYEAPLVDGDGRHTGWMSAVLDLSAQRRVEELSRLQQDRLQATARLATVGEMASLLSHELNQPLAAIASYASGSLNVIADGDADAAASTHAAPPPAATAEERALLRQALVRIAEQAERAGRVIKSVHDFVRRREQVHESLPAAHLIDAVLPLARMQARKSGTRIEIDLPVAPALPPRVRCDRTMVEQVLLNLARNAMQAMEAADAAPERVLTLQVRQTAPAFVGFAVIDTGPGITPEVAAQLYTPFFTTKPEGMGLGLSLCRTVVEQHGGVLEFDTSHQGRGTVFRFTLPSAPAAVPPDASASHAGARGAAVDSQRHQMRQTRS